MDKVTRRCPTCNQPVEGPAYDARDAGYDPAQHCVLLANNHGRVVDCVMVARVGYQRCHVCPVFGSMVVEVRDKHGRTKEVIK